MHAMILAAGRGERLRPLTDQTPKPLLRAGPRRLIEYHLEALRRAGIRDVVINVAHLADQIRDCLGDGSRYGVDIRYSDESGHALETGGGIFRALPLLRSDPFLVVNGDIWTDLDLATLPQTIDSEAHLLLVDNPDHHRGGDFGLHDGCVTDIEQGEPSWTFSGIGLYRHDLFRDCRPGRFPLAPLLRSHFRDCRVTGQVYRGEWIDVGTQERLRQLAARLVEQPDG